MKVTPLSNRVLLRVIDDDRKTKGGIYIPDIGIEGTPYRFGEVVACGPGRLSDAGVLIPMSVSVGDIVMMWRKNDGQQIVVPTDDGELLMITEPFIVGKVSGLDRVSSLQGIDGKPMVMQ